MVISGAVRLARQLRLSELFIGLTILAIGSDLPELAVAVSAGIKTLHGSDASGVVVGGSIGSAFGQIGLVMGISGLIGFMALPRRYVYRHGTALLGSIVLLFVAGMDGVVTRLEGVALVTAFAVYLVALWIHEQKDMSEPPKVPARVVSAGAILLIGITIVISCSHLTVGSATSLAARLGVDQTVIAIVVIGIGTSLPELTISVGAMLKRKIGISAGNLIGSNILDALVPVGLAAMIAPLKLDPTTLYFDLPALFILSLLVLIFLRFRHGLQKKEALVIITFYVVYVLLKVGQFGGAIAPAT